MVHITFYILPILICLASMLTMGCSDRSEPPNTFRIAYVMSPGGTSHQGAIKIKELIEADDELGMQCKLYPNAILGKDRELMELLQLDGVDMVIGGPSVIGMYNPAYQILEAPFLFRDYDHLHSILDGPIGMEMRDEMRTQFGFEYLGFFLRGPRYLTTSSKIITQPTDLAGLKLRVPELNIYIQSWNTFGANPTPIPFSDMFMALRQGVVEGQENPLEVIYTNNLQEVQKYVMETKHLLSFYAVVVGRSFQEKFNAMQKEKIAGYVDQAATYHDALMDEFEAEYKEKLRAAGMEFVPVDRSGFEQLAKVKLPTLLGDRGSKQLFEEIVNAR